MKKNESKTALPSRPLRDDSLVEDQIPKELELWKRHPRTTRILLGYNGSKLSQAALYALIEHHRAPNAQVEVKVLYAVPTYVWDGQGSPARCVVDQAARVLISAGFTVETSILKGAASDAIVDAAQEWNADIIVIGWHAWSAFQRFLFGSMATAVTNHASCPVELVSMRSGAAV